MDTEALNIDIEGRVANGACDLLGDRSVAYGWSQSCSSTRQSTRGPRISATGLFRVSRDPKRAGSRAEFKGTDFRRACHHSGNDEHCLIGGAHDPTCGNANVHSYSRTKRKCHRAHPQPKRGELIARLTSAQP